MQILLPCEDQYMRTIATQRPTYTVRSYDRLTSSLEREVVALFEREINYHVRIESCKRALCLRYDWTARSAFETIDRFREYNLNQRNISDFLRLNGFVATESELIAIVRRLDTDGDNRVTLEEYSEAMRPAFPSPCPRPEPSCVPCEELKRSASPLR